MNLLNVVLKFSKYDKHHKDVNPELHNVLQ